MDDLINQPPMQPDIPARPKRGRWLRRFLLGFLLIPAVLCCVFFWFVHDTRSRPPYCTALALIQNDPQMVQHLGQPIRDLRWLPTAGYPEQFQMQVKGPKGLADISVRAGEFDGKWELKAVDVFVRKGSQRLSLNTGSGTDDAPIWSPGGSTTEGEESGDLGLEPPSGIDIQLPGEGPPGVEIDLPEMNIKMPEVPPGPES